MKKKIKYVKPSLLNYVVYWIYNVSLLLDVSEIFYIKYWIYKDLKLKCDDNLHQKDELGTLKLFKDTANIEGAKICTTRNEQSI